MRTGVVSFIDVLGWKGIWVNHKNALELLTTFRNKLDSEARSLYTSVVKNTRDKPNLEIILFSDTIVIFTPNLCDFSTALQFHSQACKLALETGLEFNLPLRGVIGYGDYAYYSKNSKTMIGPVIDEISSWNGKVDWIGVILAPSVRFKLRFNDISVENFDCVRKYPIPFKENIKGLDLCVRWGDSKGIELLKDFLNNQISLPPEVASKYLNTLSFLESPDKVTVKDKKEFENTSTEQNHKDMEKIEKYILKKHTIIALNHSDIRYFDVSEISSDSVTFSWFPPAESEVSLKIGKKHDFDIFSIRVLEIIEGLTEKLVELEVEWKN